MKLQDSLPEGVTVDGRFYRMDFDFRNVLRMIDILDDNTLLPEAKAYNALHCLCKRPRNVLKVCNAVKDLLFNQRRKKAVSAGPKVTDWVQDAALIRAAFRQAYGIDLYREKLHWFEFSELLGAIPEGNRYSDIMEIRARPMPAPTKWNQHEREWLMKAKAECALEINEKDRMRKYHQDVGNVASAIMAWAKGSVKKNG